MTQQCPFPMAFLLFLASFISCCFFYIALKDNSIVNLIASTSRREESQTKPLSRTIANESSWSVDVPTIPTISTDGNLIILSANAARIRYGGCITFVMVFPQDMSRVARTAIAKNRTSSTHLNLWCFFDDGSHTPVYTADVPIPNEPVSILDCPLNSFARHQLWTLNRTLRVFLVTHRHRNQSIPLAQALITLPQRIPQRSTVDEQILTLCTSPLRSTFKFLPQWIEYHRHVGFRKFIIYNTSDTKNELPAILDTYSRVYPDLIDVMQWNFDHLRLKDWHGRRYFQVEALHDCLFRYGDYSDWLGIIDLDEYIVPLPPYKRVDEYLQMNFKRAEIGSINLQSFFYCDIEPESLKIEDPLVIERFTIRAKEPFKGGRTKYLCRPHFVQNLGIHRQYYGLPSKKPSYKHLILAHYISMNVRRNFADCSVNRTISDRLVSDLFGKVIHKQLSDLGFKSIDS